MTARLHLVSPSPLRGGGKSRAAAKGEGENLPEEMLAELVPELIRAEELVDALRGLVDSWRYQLASKRGVAFIRPEQVRREFGA